MLFQDERDVQYAHQEIAAGKSESRRQARTREVEIDHVKNLLQVLDVVLGDNTRTHLAAHSKLRANIAACSFQIFRTDVEGSLLFKLPAYGVD